MRSVAAFIFIVGAVSGETISWTPSPDAHWYLVDVTNRTDGTSVGVWTKEHSLEWTFDPNAQYSITVRSSRYQQLSRDAATLDYPEPVKEPIPDPDQLPDPTPRVVVPIRSFHSSESLGDLALGEDGILYKFMNGKWEALPPITVE